MMNELAGFEVEAPPAVEPPPAMRPDNEHAREYWQRQHAARGGGLGEDLGGGDGARTAAAAARKTRRQKQPRKKKEKKPTPIDPRQRKLNPAKESQRRARAAARRAPVTDEHGRPIRDEDFVPPSTFVNSAQVTKDARYYRRRGPIWTDAEVHVPQSRKHLLGLRPDLDRKHEAYVQSVIAKEKRAEARVLQRRLNMRADTQELLQDRRAENLVAEETALNWGRKQQQQQQQQTRPATANVLASRTREGIIKKDWKFYRRQGAIWTDLVHLPPERLHFVLRPQIVKMDRDATRLIRHKYEAEIDVEYANQAIKMERAGRIRKQFTKSVARRRDKMRSMWKREPPFSTGNVGLEHDPAAGGSNQQGGQGGGRAVRPRPASAAASTRRARGGMAPRSSRHQQQPHGRRRMELPPTHTTTATNNNNSNTAKSRLDLLALPKSAAHTKRPNTQVGMSYRGLLSCDTTVGPILQEHWRRQGYDMTQPPSSSSSSSSSGAAASNDLADGTAGPQPSITSVDEVRVDTGVTSRQRPRTAGPHRRATPQPPHRGGSRNLGGSSSTLSPSRRAQTARGRSSGGAAEARRRGNRWRRPQTAPGGGHVGFSGSRSGSSSAVLPPGTAGTMGSSRASSRGGGGGVAHGSSVLSYVVDEAQETATDIDDFDEKREEEEAAKRRNGVAHENWFAKPYDRGGDRGRPAPLDHKRPGAVSNRPAFWEFAASDREAARSREKEEQERGREYYSQ